MRSRCALIISLMADKHTRSLIIWWLLAVLLAVGFARLGFWQYGRAAEKRVQIAQADAALADRTPVSLLTPTFEPYEWVEGSGTFAREPVVLLDNQQRDGRVGVEVYGVFLADEIPGKRMLVDLGWVPMDGQRDWPSVTVPEGRMTVRGMRTNPPSPGIRLGDASAYLEKRGAEWLVVQLDTAAIGKALGAEVWPQVLRLDPAMKVGYERDLKVLTNTLTPEKHLGYAVQWWGLAATVLGIALVLTLRSRSRRRA